LTLILGALLLPLVPARLKKVLPAAHANPALCAHIDHGPRRIWPGPFPRLDAGLWPGGCPQLGLWLHHEPDVHPRDALRLHVKEDAQHIASWFYVAGSVGCIYAGDFITLFLFWELMAFSSVFLIWFRGRRESLWAGYRYLLVHVTGAWSCSAALCSIARRRATAGPLTSWMSTTRPPPFT
jgi:multicomponent Na+:H+ antiporter subunit D